jgi:NADPH2:quinone reductase
LTASVQFELLVASLRANGTLVLIGAVGGSEVRFDVWHLIKPVTLTGYSTETPDGPTLQSAADFLSKQLADGNLRLPKYQVFPLHEAGRAHDFF